MVKIRATDNYHNDIQVLAQNETFQANCMRMMEECAELSVAVSKIARGDMGKESMHSLLEEIADVIICIDILRELIDIEDEKLEEILRMKMYRNILRL